MVKMSLLGQKQYFLYKNNVISSTLHCLPYPFSYIQKLTIIITKNGTKKKKLKSKIIQKHTPGHPLHVENNKIYGRSILVSKKQSENTLLQDRSILSPWVPKNTKLLPKSTQIAGFENKKPPATISNKIHSKKNDPYIKISPFDGKNIPVECPAIFLI